MFNWQETRELPWLKSNTILLTLVGSQAYGTATDESDYDYKGICIPPKEYVLGNLKTFHQSGFKYDNTEVEIYGLPKYISLAWEANPNILELLFTNEKHYVILNSIGKVLLKIREKFLSKKVKHTYSGYAHAQLKRIETHRKWLLYPPSHNPTREEYGLANTTLLSQDILGPIEALHNKEGEEYINKTFPEAILHVYFKERKYANAKRNWDQYINWQTQRNPKRAELESKFGYDVKHASHLIRLFHTGIEILQGKGLHVDRSSIDKDLLMDIRNGMWSYEKLMDYANSLEISIDAAYNNSTLPHGAPKENINNILINILEEFYYGSDISWKIMG